MVMHMYNAWLPPPVAELASLETHAFSLAVERLRQDAQSSSLATLKWISVFDNFLKAKSEVVISDVEDFVKIIFDIFFDVNGTSYVQGRWGRVLIKFLKKYAKRLNLILDWRPFYDLIVASNFKGRDAFEGLALKQFQVDSVFKITRKCRRFFPKTAAKEIWMEFRPMLDDLSHNASLAGAGFVSLLLPTNGQVDLDFFTSEWFDECLILWDEVPSCSYWDLQWASLIGRCIRNHSKMPNLNMEIFVARCFSHYIRSFEVPLGNSTTIYPYRRHVPKEVSLAFSSDWSLSLSKEVAESIVYLLKPNGSAQNHLQRMIDLLEQYYHPSNGGAWTPSLERFLHYLVSVYMKRLRKQERKHVIPFDTPDADLILSSKERRLFVEVVMQLIERAQFSKNGGLAKAAATAASSLAYIEPGLVLPFCIARFYTAFDTMTATHQLEAALKTVALSARALMLASGKESPSESYQENSPDIDYDEPISSELLTSCRDVLEFALIQLLSGLDANDPSKTLATLQLYCSIFSNLGKLGYESSSLLSIDWSQWLDDFLARLFNLLLHLEPGSQFVESGENSGLHISSKTFLVQGGSFYLSMIELLFSRLEKTLFEQALKRIAKFLHNNILPGAVAEVGLLCSAVVYANPTHTLSFLMQPLMNAVVTALSDVPATGFSGSDHAHAISNTKSTVSPAVEVSVSYQLDLLALGLMYAGESIVEFKDMLKNVVTCSFDVPSTKVNEAGSRLLSSILRCAVLYYPLDQYKLQLQDSSKGGVEDWVTTKLDYSSDIWKKCIPLWHLAGTKEVSFAKEFLDFHLTDALAELKEICLHGISTSTGNFVHKKNHLRALLLQIDASLRGIQSCLPDSFDSCSSIIHNQQDVEPCFIAGSAGVAIGSSELREEAANTLHLACEYLLMKRADDISLLLLLIRSVALIVNSGSIEYLEWSNAKTSIIAESACLVEPSTNYILNIHSKGHLRPNWMVIEKVLLHNTWRASQSHYNLYRIETDSLSVPQHIILLTNDLVKLSLHNYDAVRVIAARALNKTFKRFPSCISSSLPDLFRSLQDVSVKEHAAIGACEVLASRAVSRFLTQDFAAFSEFLSAMLQSAHHETVKAQNAINRLFIIFVMRFSGLPDISNLDSKLSVNDVYTDLNSKILNVCASGDNVPWRYKLMQEGILILLSSQKYPNKDQRLHDLVVEHYLLNLKNPLPPLRPLSVVSLLFLLRQSCQEAASVLDAAIMQEKDYGSIVLHNLSLDHHYEDGQIRAHQGGTFGRLIAQFAGTTSLTSWMAVGERDWPRTRTWDSSLKGNAFSPKYCKLFKRLVQRYGNAALEAFRVPLEQSLSAIDELGKQCAAAEVIAGFLHSDMECVVKGWNEWLKELLQKFLAQATVESMPEWAACVRFSVTGKGMLGRTPPFMRSELLKCLMEPLPASASSNLIVKHFTYLLAAVSEVFFSVDDVAYQEDLLRTAMSFIQNPAPQVREVIGTIICIVGTNLELIFSIQKERIMLHDQMVNFVDWKESIIHEAKKAALKCHSLEAHQIMESIKLNDFDDPGKKDGQECLRLMETVLNLVIAGMKSGRSIFLMDVIVKLLQPILSLQEISHKELSSLAKVALHLLKFQVFPTAQLQEAVEALLSAVNDSNWHIRMEALNFLQSFMYRHMYLLSKDSILQTWHEMKKLLADSQLEVRELASATLTRMMKGADDDLSCEFRNDQLGAALTFLNASKSRRKKPASEPTSSLIAVHAVILGLAACVLSVPYDMPRWLPKAITTLARFAQHDSSAIRETVRKTIAEFRRTHADTWTIQKSMFTEEELEILADTSSSASYFA